MDLMQPLSRRAVRALTEAHDYDVKIERVGRDSFVMRGAVPSGLEWRLRAFRDEILAVLDWWESQPVPPREAWV